MRSVYALAPNESWIVDRFVNEWRQDNADITAPDAASADVIWLYADWAWDHIPRTVLAAKRVITTVHHIVPEKFGDRERANFDERDKFTHAYHVPNEHTGRFIASLTQRPIHEITYWANQRIWRSTGTKDNHRIKFGIPLDSYVIGSFQRDTEGSDLCSPKLEKGPDLLADAIAVYANRYKNVHVILAGWRRQYISDRLKLMGVPFSYYELPPQNIINDLYQCLDLYPVTARYEGGPQSLIECGLLGIPCVSRDIGIAHQVLPTTAISSDVTMARAAIPSVHHLRLPGGYEPYRKLIQTV